MAVSEHEPVEIPDFMRAAIEAQGAYDPDEIARAAENVDLDETWLEEIAREALLEGDPGRDGDDPGPGSDVKVDEQGTLLADPVGALPDPARNRLGKFSDPAKSGAPETQREAAVGAYPGTGTARKAVLDVIGHSHGNGVTDEEIETALGMRHQSASARRHELVADGWAEDSGKRRQTRSGRDAVVWVLTERGLAEWRPA